MGFRCKPVLSLALLQCLSVVFHATVIRRVLPLVVVVVVVLVVGIGGGFGCP